MSRAVRVIILAAAFLVPIIALAAAVPGPATTGSTVAAPQATTSATTKADNGDTTVYITKSGKKYHADGCSSLSKSRTSIKLKDAVARGYTPCSRCNPPTLQAGKQAATAPTATTAAITTAPAAATAQATRAQDDNGDTTVYITRTGAKYHRAGCSSLSRSSIPIKLRDAVARGYGACSRCRPPTLMPKEQ